MAARVASLRWSTRHTWPVLRTVTPGARPTSLGPRWRCPTSPSSSRPTRASSPVTGIDPGTKYLLLEAPTPSDRCADLLDLGCGYGPIALTLARRAPAGRRVGGRRRTSGPSTCAPATPSRRPRQRHGSPWPHRAAVATDQPTAIPDDVRFDAIWSNPPIRIGKPALHELLARLARPPPADGRTPTSWCRSTWAPTRCSRWLADQGWPTERLGSRAGYRILDVSARRPTVGAIMSRNLTSHRAQAPPPRVAPPHRGPPRTAARRRADAVQRRVDPAHGGGAARRAPVAGRRDRGADRRQDAEDRARLADSSSRGPSATSIAEAVRRGEGRRATGSSASSWPTARGRCHELDLAERRLPRRRPRGPRPVHRSRLTACDAIGYLPMLGKIGSLNVATAASMAMYEVRRQEWTPSRHSPT